MTSSAAASAKGPAWTPRQREVLNLLARGRTNGQIAEALGISLDGAKWHVGEIITKLDVDTREEAAEYWRQRQGLRARMRVLTRTGSAPALLRWLAIGGGAVAAALVVGVAAFAMTRGGDDEQAAPDPSPTVVGTATLEPGVTPTTTGNAEEGPLTEIGGVAVRDLSIGPEIELPQGVVLYYRQGCYGCDGPGRMQRAYRDASGQVVSEPIELGLPADDTGLLSLMVASDGEELLAQFCDDQKCSGLGGFEPGAVLHTYVSTDGGTTWNEEVPGLPVDSYVRGSVGDEWLVVTLRPGQFNHRYWLYPSGDTLNPPIANAEPWPTGGGSVFWWEAFDPQRTIQVDNNGDLLPGIGVDPGLVATFMAGDPFGDAFYSGYARQDYSMRGSTGIYLVRTEGDRASAAYRWPYFSLNSIGLVGGRWLVGNALYPDGQPDSQVPDLSQSDYRPVLIDLESATVHSIAGLPRGSGGWSYPAEVVTGGAVLRVAADGSCLNVRAEPAVDAESLRCYVDGVLLFERETDGAVPDGWVPVTTPDGREGWASAEFLER